MRLPRLSLGFEVWNRGNWQPTFSRWGERGNFVPLGFFTGFEANDGDEAYEHSICGPEMHHQFPLQNIDMQTSGITVTKDRERIETFTFAHPHPMAQSIGYFNLTKMLFVLLMLLNAFVEVREGSEFDMRETDAAFPAVP